MERRGPLPDSKCPCRSGRRFAACCLPAERRETQLRQRILHFAHSPRYLGARRAADAAFWTEGARERDDEGVASGIAFLTIFTMDHRLPDGQTIVAEFLDAERLSAKDREIVEKLQRGRWGLLEVRDVRPGQFVKVRDVFTEETFELRDVSASRGLAKWDVIYTRIIRGRGAWLGDGSLLRGPPERLLPLVAALEGIGAKKGARDTPELLSLHAARAYNAVIAVLDEPAYEAYFTYEGDPIALATAAYRVKDPETFAEVLDSLPDLYEAGVDEEERLTFTWAIHESKLVQKAIPAEKRALRFLTHLIPKDAEDPMAARLLNLGMVMVSLDGRVEIECMSVERRRGLVAKLEATGCPLLLLEERSRPIHPGELGRDEEEPPPKRKDSGVSKREAQRMRRAMAAEFLKEWPKTAISSLGGLTPTEAARHPEHRTELVQMLKSMSHRSEESGGVLHARDVVRLARELDLADELKR